ncbi:MAG TPA: hypothetical protein VKR79_07745 [Gaiellaceae bacterium]|nr:hypothetical protein [Gaiellaceae bacterium]
MTRGERRGLLACAIVLAVVCSAFFARAVFAQRAADYARAQARAAFVLTPASPASDFAQREMIAWSGGTDQMRYWQALQRFRLVSHAALAATQYTLSPSLGLLFRLEETETSLRAAAALDDSRQRRSRLDDMLGLAYFEDAELHQGEFPVEPQLERKAIAAFQTAVLLDSSNDPAKTNLELLLKQGEAKAPVAQQQKLQPDTTRVLGLLQSANGLPSQNGAVGLRVHGGY